MSKVDNRNKVLPLSGLFSWVWLIHWLASQFWTPKQELTQWDVLNISI